MLYRYDNQLVLLLYIIASLRSILFYPPRYRFLIVRPPSGSRIVFSVRGAGYLSVGVTPTVQPSEKFFYLTITFLSCLIAKHEVSCVSLPYWNDKRFVMSKKTRKYDVKYLRKRLKLSQSEAASKIGVSTRTWQRMEYDGATIAEFIGFVDSIGSFVTTSPIDVFKVGEEVFNSKNFEK